MTITHILVDFENVQPTAADIGLVRGDSLRLAIFRGPGQMKYAAEVAEAWQPLGANVTFVRCAKAGRNAVDMHIAFYLGARIAECAQAGAAQRARFVIVSRDTDFDPLLMHIRSEGFEATRTASIKAALGGHAVERAETRPAKVVAKAPAAKKAAKVAAKSGAGRKTAKKAPAAKAVKVAAPAATAKSAPARAAKEAAAPDARAKVIDSLQRMGEKRPNKRKGLERHIESHLGRNLQPGVLEALLAQLERDGVLVFDDNKVTYSLPAAKK